MIIATMVYEAIKSSLRTVSTTRNLKLDDATLDDMARNAAQGIIFMFDTIEDDEACSLCGACPICGKRESHVH